MRTFLVVLLPLAALAAPMPAPVPAPAPAAGGSAAEPNGLALGRAESAALRFGSTLKKRVVEELGKGGPVSAVAVCSVEAPMLATTIRGETGVALGRSSLRLRNPANVAPGWVQAWLVAQGERPAAGVVPLATVVDGKARVIKPIAVEAPCLVCHGPKETLAPDVRAELATRYPADTASGYVLGDLRGALWAEVDVDP
jgi:hypothetical protein